MDKVYKVTLPSYLANGGDGFQMIKDELLKHDSGKHRCLFLSCSQRYSAQKHWAEKSQAEESLCVCCWFHPPLGIANSSAALRSIMPSLPQHT
jgi:hypothetical protein